MSAVMSTGLQEHDIMSMLGAVSILSDHMRQQETAFLFYRVCWQSEALVLSTAAHNMHGYGTGNIPDSHVHMPLGVQSSAKCVNLYPMLDLRHAVQAVL